MNKPTKMAAIGSAVVLMFGLAACGDEDDDASADGGGGASVSVVLTDGDLDTATATIDLGADVSTLKVSAGKIESPSMLGPSSSMVNTLAPRSMVATAV